MDWIMRVENLFKSYNNLKAVDDVSFKIKRGSLFAFLGPNGAGKSTTISIMTKLLKADGGKVYLNEQTNDVYFRNKIGVVFQGNILDDNLTVKENLIFRGSSYIKSKKDVFKRYEELKDYLEFSDYENQRYKTLSGGQKRRAEIARALFSNPEILLLDEPTTGLDPETRQIVWNVIDDLKNNSGMTIFLTTHYMEEAANADHVVIIDKGKIVVEGTPAFLKKKYSSDLLKIVPKNKTNFENLLKGLNRDYTKIADQYIIKASDTEDVLSLINKIDNNINQFEVTKGTMDDVFINVVGGNNNVWISQYD